MGKAGQCMDKAVGNTADKVEELGEDAEETGSGEAQ